MKRAKQQAGLTPGTPVYIGEKKIEKVRIRIVDYDVTRLEEKEITTIEEWFPFKDKPTVTWINIDGLHDIKLIEKIGKYFDLHPLVLEDIVNTEQRPKLEDFGNYIFLVLKMLHYDNKKNELEAEQVSLIFGSNFVISFQERVGHIFEPLRERIRKGKGRIRKSAADYLAYALVDSIVDNYFIILEQIGERMEDTEQELAANPTQETLQTIRVFKKEMIFLRKSIWPLRELVNSLDRSESSLVDEATGIYLKDVYDHTIQIIDTVESFRDMLSGMLDVYLSSISNKMNEVMKVLTIFASIFIPLTFVAGLYGMNFQFMPELEWRWGYFAALGFMILVGLSLAVYFKRKRWL
ncbi:magnesium/cobalt transporter CorA [Chloroflexota bacterium]